MDPLSYERLIQDLDAEIASARAEEDRRRRRALLQSQMEGLRSRREALAALGREDRAREIDGILAQIEAEISPPPPPPPPKPVPPLDPETRAQMLNLGVEVEGTRADLRDVSAAERALQFKIWALRWRTTTERVGQDVARTDTTMRRAYAILRESMEQYPDLPFIEALDPRRTGDWDFQLASAKQELRLVRDRETRRKEVEEKLEELRAIVAKYHLPEDPEGVQALRDAVRALAPVVPVRERLLEICGPFREILEEEFGFLWGTKRKERVVETEATRLANRELAGRILSRMIAKKEIGGKHTSIDNLYQGIPDHDRGRAKEFAEMLVRTGLVRTKQQHKDLHVSLEPEWVHAIEQFVQGAPLGVEPIDRWCQLS
jgi:hypothetical protein